jgi:hypothetical protein
VWNWGVVKLGVSELQQQQATAAAAAPAVVVEVQQL